MFGWKIAKVAIARLLLKLCELILTGESTRLLEIKIERF